MARASAILSANFSLRNLRLMAWRIVLRVCPTCVGSEFSRIVKATICRQWLRRLFDGVPNAPRIVHESMEFQNHLELARAGLALALVPRLGRGELGPDLVAVPTADPASTRDVLTVHRRTQADSPALQVALEAIARHARHGV